MSVATFSMAARACSAEILPTVVRNSWNWSFDMCWADARFAASAPCLNGEVLQDREALDVRGGLVVALGEFRREIHLDFRFLKG